MSKPIISWRDLPLQPPVYIPAQLTEAEREALASEALAQRIALAIRSACWGAIIAILIVLVLS